MAGAKAGGRDGATRGGAGRGEATRLEKELLDLVEAKKLSSYELGRLADVPEEVIRRFRKRERGISLGTAGRLCEALGVGFASRARRR